MADDKSAEMDAGEAGVPEDGAFDGDATSGSLAAGAAPDGSTPLPDAHERPPIDGGVMGAIDGNGQAGVTPRGADDGDDVEPEESGR